MSQQEMKQEAASKKRFLYLLAWTKPGNPAKLWGSGTSVSTGKDILALYQDGNPNVEAWVFFTDTQELAESFGLDRAALIRPEGCYDSICFCVDLPPDFQIEGTYEVFYPGENQLN